MIKASNGAPIRRLEKIYDALYVDEAQDIRGNDLCVLEQLLRSRIAMHLVLDPRQSTLSTTTRDPKYKKRYEAHKILELYRQWEKRGLLSITYENETHRSAPSIARLSDLILGPNIGLERTVSHVPERGFHDGVFLIGSDAAERYSGDYSATLLAVKKSDSYDVAEAFNFGKSKGLTRDDVVIVASTPIEQFLMEGKPLKPQSACGFYVAVTRARYSVAIAVKDPGHAMKGMGKASSILRTVNARLLVAQPNANWITSR